MSGSNNDSDDKWRDRNQRPPQQRSGKDGGGGNSPSDECDIIESTQLNSPDPSVLAVLKPGDILKVEFEGGPPILLKAVASNGQTAGTITSASMADIISCIQQGREYVTVVESIQGGICHVRVELK